MKKCLAIFVLMAPMIAFAEKPVSWKINFVKSSSKCSFAQLNNTFALSLVNPDASCLSKKLTFESDMSWTKKSSPALIERLSEGAGCKVAFKGRIYALGESVQDAARTLNSIDDLESKFDGSENADWLQDCSGKSQPSDDINQRLKRIRERLELMKQVENQKGK